MRNVLCQCCSEPAVEYEYYVDHLDGKVMPCISCSSIGRVDIDMDDEGRVRADFRILSKEDLSFVDFGIVVDAYELAQKKLDEAYEQNSSLQEKLRKIALVCDPKHPGAVIQASDVLDIIYGKSGK